MYTDKICEAVKTLSGMEGGAITRLAESAQAELEGRLKPDVKPADIESKFIAAAAFLTLSIYGAITAGSDITEYSAGSVKVKRGGNAGMAELSSSMRKEAEVLMAPYISDGGFAFKGVDG